MKKIIGGALLLWSVVCGAQVPPEAEALSRMTEMATMEKAKACFVQSRVMSVVIEGKKAGKSLDDYLELAQRSGSDPKVIEAAYAMRGQGDQGMLRVFEACLAKR